MKCVVCDHDIRIDTLKQLFTLHPLLLCSRCAQKLVPKSMDVLYHDNDWIRSVIDKLNQGDLILIQLFKPHLQKALLKKGAIHSNISMIEAKKDLTYPWLEILVNSIIEDSQRGYQNLSAETLVVAVEAQKKTNHQIAIIG